MATQIRIERLIGDTHGAPAQFVQRAVLPSQNFKMLKPNRHRHVLPHLSDRSQNNNSRLRLAPTEITTKFGQAGASVLFLPGRDKSEGYHVG